MAAGHGRTDLAEMAQVAGVEALWAAPGPRAPALFGTGPIEVRKGFAALATAKRFGEFARPFFARFAYKVLAYLLSRLIPLPVGDGRAFRTLADAERFADALRTHCREATHHHARFAADWFSLHRFEAAGDITRDETQRFFGHAMTKLTGELRRREGGRGR
jgi:hypothetical protein